MCGVGECTGRVRRRLLRPPTIRRSGWPSPVSTPSYFPNELRPWTARECACVDQGGAAGKSQRQSWTRNAFPNPQLQQGYDVDLLSEGPRHPPPPNLHDHEHNQPDPTTVHEKSPYTNLSPGYKRVPFWRTRAGMAVIAILTIIIIGAIVGGAVGGTVGSHKSSSTTTASDGSGGSDSDHTTGVPPATTTINSPIS